MKFAVVPDSSERCTGVMSVSGRSAPGFVAAIAGSFHFVISPLKIFAVVSGVELQAVDAREVVDDRDRRQVVRDLDQVAAPPQRCVALGSSSVSNGESLPAKAAAAGDELIAAAAGPDRVIRDRRAGVLVLDLAIQASWAACWALEPAPAISPERCAGRAAAVV